MGYAIPSTELVGHHHHAALAAGTSGFIISRNKIMNERAEYFAILNSLLANDVYNSVSDLVDSTYRIWYAANQCCKDAHLTNTTKEES